MLPAVLTCTLLLCGCAASPGYGGNPLGGLLGGILGTNDPGDRELSQFERAAVSACGREADDNSRDRVRVTRVDQITRDTVRVDGNLETRDTRRDNFTCTFRSDGRIVDFRIF
ncbi:hypothetical protein GRF63_01990 [Erythrobacter sp. GH3-10]|uniref:Uncharacterized protein n=1 Tax=Aurantiacibacter rhizosphaerae TaxID=2691582 RepID=A0A844XAW3_9SPHN|nr:hypothetical protein [Aurantiacibacter rhizosphaerae]